MQRTGSRIDGNILHLAVSWVLMVPLAYFASRGLFWFQSVKTNNLLSSDYGFLATASMTGMNIGVAIPVFSVIFLLLLPKTKSISNLCRIDKVFIALSMLAISSSLWSQYPGKSFGWSLCLTGETLFAFYLHRSFCPAGILQLFLMLGWICGLFSIVLALLFPQYGVEQGLGVLGAWRGMYDHKNVCSIMTVFLLSPAFYVPIRGLHGMALRVAYISLSIGLVVMTQARTGWVLLACLLATVVLLKLAQRISRPDRKVVFFAGAYLLAPLAMCGVFHASELVYLLGKDPTLTGRTDIWKSVMVSITKRPILGFGYMGFWRGFEGESANNALNHGGVLTHAHNGFLDIWLTLGILGFGLVLYSFVRAFGKGLSCIRLREASYLQWYFCIVMLVAFVNADEAELMMPNNLTWIMYILACVGLSDAARSIRLEREDG